MPSVPIANCSTFIQIWVDDTAVTNGQTTGVYAVDNNVNSQNQGSANLITQLPTGQSVCWQAYMINTQTTASVTITSIGNSDAWSFSGQPQNIGGGVFTGTVQNSGSNGYTVNLTIILAGGSGVPVTLNLGINTSP